VRDHIYSTGTEELTCSLKAMVLRTFNMVRPLAYDGVDDQIACCVRFRKQSAQKS
jgi:hypothetical protein